MVTLYIPKSSFLHPSDDGRFVVGEIRDFVETVILPLMERRKIYPSSSLGVAVGHFRRMPEYQQVWGDPASLVAAATYWGGAAGEHRAINAMCKMRPAAREGMSSAMLAEARHRGEYAFHEVVTSSIERSLSADFPWGDYPQGGAVFSRPIRPEGLAWLVGVDGTDTSHDGLIAGMIADYLFAHYPG